MTTDKFPSPSLPNRLYVVRQQVSDNVTDDEDYAAEDYTDDSAFPAPEGWADYCIEKWGEVREFFLPSLSRIYLSRSAAQERADLYNVWAQSADRAVVFECTPGWETVTEANERRARRRIQKRITQLEDALHAEKAKLAQGSN